MHPPEVENPCSIVNNRYTGEVGRARKKLEEMLEKYKNPFNGLHAFCAFVIHNKRNSTSLKIFRSYPTSIVASDLIRNLSAFDLTALGHVKQTKQIALSYNCSEENSKVTDLIIPQNIAIVTLEVT